MFIIVLKICETLGMIFLNSSISICVGFYGSHGMLRYCVWVPYVILSCTVLKSFIYKILKFYSVHVTCLKNKMLYTVLCFTGQQAIKESTSVNNGPLLSLIGLSVSSLNSQVFDYEVLLKGSLTSIFLFFENNFISQFMQFNCP